MNKKGFTLTELLAVLLILSILMIVSVPTVLNLVSENKSDTFINDIKKMNTNVEYYINSGKIKVPNDVNKCSLVNLNYIDNNEFETSPFGGSYDKVKSYVIVSRDENKYKFTTTLIEEVDDYYKGVLDLESKDLEKSKKNLRENIKNIDIETFNKININDICDDEYEYIRD